MRLEIKSFQETLHAGMCGPASLKMVLNYWGVSKDEKELSDLCGVTKDRGTSSQMLKKVAENLGFKVEIKNNSTLDDIEEWLNKKVPVIVNWFTRGRNDYSDSDVADGHYSVVVGLDDEHIYIEDPEIGGLRKLSRKDFLKVWFDFTESQINTWDEMIIRQCIAITLPFYSNNEHK